MKILQINALYGNKSTGSIVRDIHLMLRTSSIESQVACISSSEHSDEIVELGYSFDNKFHGIITRLNGKQGFYSRRSTRKLLSIINEKKPDVIHLHNVHSNFLNLPMLFDYASKKGIPVILTLHDAWYFTGKCYHFFDNGCDRWMTECHDCPKRRADIPSLLTDSTRKVFRSKSKMYSSVELHVVGCSKWITECAKQSPIFAGAHFHQIYNGADAAVFNPMVKDLRDELNIGNEFVVLTMANKWFDGQNEATRSEVLSFISEIGGRLIIVGARREDQDRYRSDGGILCIEYVDDCEYMARLYRTADVFLNLTLVDTLPTVNIESAMCGTPIVTYGSGGSGELVLDGSTGYVTEPRDTEAIVASLRLVHGGAISREACSAWGTANFEKNANYKKYLDLYSEILHGERNESRG